MEYFNQESERLRYRALSLADIPAWKSFFHGNSRLRFLGISPDVPVDTLASQWVYNQLERYGAYGYGHLAVELKTDGQLIGNAGVLRKEVEGQTEWEVAYSFIPEFWGQGFGTEAARQVKKCGFALISPPRLISIIHEENEPSMHVARKNGMRFLFRSEHKGMPVKVFGAEAAG